MHYSDYTNMSDDELIDQALLVNEVDPLAFELAQRLERRLEEIDELNEEILNLDDQL